MTAPADALLGEIAGRARTLQERLATPVRGAGDAGTGEAALRHWRAVLDGAQRPGRLRRRLERFGLTESEAVGRLANRPWEGAALPGWALTLGGMLQASFDEPPAQAEAPPEDEPIAFQHALWPFVQYAARELVVRSPSAVRLLLPPARSALERSLLRSLGELASLTLFEAFHEHRLRHDPLALLLPPEQRRGERRQYEAFVGGLRRGGWRGLLRARPVLGRLLAQRVSHWIAASAELVERLAGDLDEIARTFAGGSLPGRVVALETGLSDPHAGGRTVAVLRFESGLRIVYKPRPVEAEEAYHELATALADAGAPHAPLAAKVLARAGYGWVEWIGHTPCEGEPEVEGFYARAGALAALFYLLGASDVHHENLIARGGWPVLVDAEILLAPRMRDWSAAAANAQAQASELFQGSVLGSGLFPMWSVSGRGRVVDVGGLGGGRPQESGGQRWEIRDPNSDAMEVVRAPVRMVARENLPRLAEEVRTAGAYADALVGGFEAMYGFLRAHRGLIEKRIAAGGSLAALELRILFRNTGTYAALLDRLGHPSLLASGALFGAEIDALALPFTVSPEEGVPPAGILEAEQDAVADLDVPLFTVGAAARDLRFGGRIAAPGAIAETALERVAARLRRLSPEDQALQAGLVRAALQARFNAPASAAGSVARAERRMGTGARPGAAARGAPATPEAALQRANEIGALLAQRAIRGADGSVTWLGFAFDHGSESIRLEALGSDLYGGRAGVALFLAALHRVTGDAAMARLARAAIAPQAGEEPGRPLQEAAAGIAGAGGLLYAWTRVGAWLGDEGLLAAALRIAPLLGRGLARGASPHDVVEGDAGALLALLALHGETGAAVALEAAVCCGERLLSAAEGDTQGLRWPSHPQRPAYPGFAHGASGIAHALARLHAATGDERYAGAALRGLQWAAGRYAQEQVVGLGRGWCHGAAGHALARMAAAPLLGPGDPPLAAALEGLSAPATSQVDHLCCGTFGVTEALHRGATLPQFAPLRPLVLQHARLPDDAAGRFAFALDHELPDAIPNPGLFRGLSGIGYVLLRLGGAHDLPSPLLVE